MRILLLADRAFGRREHAMLRRLEIGFLTMGHRVVRAVPRAAADLEEPSLSPAVIYDDREPRLARSVAVRALVQRLRAHEPSLLASDGGLHFDVIHVFGNRAWMLALRLAAVTGAAVAAELWSSDSIAQAVQFERRAQELLGGAGHVVWITPNARMHEAARDHDLAERIALAPWGVHAPRKLRLRTRKGGPLSLSVVCSGRDASAITPLLKAVAELGMGPEKLLVFLDASAVEQQPSIWRRADKLGLLDRLSLIADMESRRDLVLETDVVAFPDMLGELRTILLDAMASGVVVLARPDPLIEATATSGVALLVERPTPEDWIDALRTVLADSVSLQRLAEKGWEQVRERRPAHRQLDRLVEAYEAVLADEPLPFEAASA
jgi:glycosyltransferase involved in cell wall biosynthesis